MRVPLSWLREWVDWPADWGAPELARRLTFAGFEIEAIELAAPPFSGVVVARILTVEPHPQADRMRLCRVATAEPHGAARTADGAEPLQIVCAAANARADLVSVLATVGATLPGGLVIGAASKRGVESHGMLCSARDLGLADSSEGLLELPADAPLGTDLRRYLDLDDVIFEVNVTPNRGDVMSVLGLARELAALSGAALKAPDRLEVSGNSEPHSIPPRAAASKVHLSVSVQAGAGAGRLLVGVVRDIDNQRTSPLWLRERLRRAGLRSINAVVDITNYVMLELGQPMHAYDLTQLHGTLSARRAVAGERLQLLDARDVELRPDVLVIADEQGPVGLAGIMGGARSAISAATRDIALEVAWFSPASMAGRARRYGLATDASQRFERGVDWCGQERALARAVGLIGSIVGGTAEAPSHAESARELPRTSSVPLRSRQLQRLLGASIAPAEIEQRLRALGMIVHADVSASPSRDTHARLERSWSVQPPSWRFDIAIEADLIEEVARLGGLDAIGELPAELPSMPRRLSSARVNEPTVMRAIADRGYQQIITYAFVDPSLQRRLFPGQPAIELANPIASDLAVMRTSLWPGLLSAARENIRRQQTRVRLFELAARFVPTSDGHREQQMLAALALGTRLPEQWASPATPLDFYDVKADLCNVLSLAGTEAQLSFVPATVGCLHPGRSARVLRAGVDIGLIGELHPALVRALDLTYTPILFEIAYEGAFRTELARAREVSRFPRIRRDLAVTVPEGVAFALVRERVTVTAASLLTELRVFDVYQGDEVETGRKSLALGLILQDLSRTLTDEDADRTVSQVLDDLRRTVDARIRE